MNKNGRTMPLCAAVAVMGITSIAAVADESIPQATVDRWGGFHVGITAGQANTRQSFSTSPGGTLITSPFFGSANWGSQSTWETDGRAIGGIVAGYDWMLTDKFLLGLEADLQDSSHTERKSASFSPAGSPVTTVTNTANTSLPWLSTVRGRVGYVVQPDLLLYATAGFAFGKENSSFSSSVTSPGSTLIERFSSNLSKESSGYTLGIGGEWAFGPNWSARLGYQYISLGTKKTQTVPTGYFGPGALASDILTVSSSYLRVNEFQLGITYRF